MSQGVGSFRSREGPTRADVEKGVTARGTGVEILQNAGETKPLRRFTPSDAREQAGHPLAHRRLPRRLIHDR